MFRKSKKQEISKQNSKTQSHKALKTQPNQ